MVHLQSVTHKILNYWPIWSLVLDLDTFFSPNLQAFSKNSEAFEQWLRWLFCAARELKLSSLLPFTWKGNFHTADVKWIAKGMEYMSGGGAVKVWLADTEPALFGHFWVFWSLLSAVFSHISSVVALFLMQPSFWSRLAALEYSSELCDSMWTSAPGTCLNLLLNAYAHNPTPFKKSS